MEKEGTELRKPIIPAKKIKLQEQRADNKETNALMNRLKIKADKVKNVTKDKAKKIMAKYSKLNKPLRKKTDSALISTKKKKQKQLGFLNNTKSPLPSISYNEIPPPPPPPLPVTHTVSVKPTKKRQIDAKQVIANKKRKLDTFDNNISLKPTRKRQIDAKQIMANKKQKLDKPFFPWEENNEKKIKYSIKVVAPNKKPFVKKTDNKPKKIAVKHKLSFHQPLNTGKLKNVNSSKRMKLTPSY